MALTPASFATATLLAALSVEAHAQETVDIGVIKDSDVKVVQNLLYPKTDKLEVGVYLGWMPFDPLVTTPNLQLSVNKHFSEDLSLSVMVGGGYGVKTLRYAELERPPYQVAPAAYRYLASALVGVEYAPIYAKMNLGGRKVVHYDIYGAGRLGATIEQSVLPDGSITAAPTLGLGVGTRFFANKGMALRFEIFDDLMVEYRALTTSWHFKQNAGLQVGVSFFPGADAKGSRK